MQNWIWTDTNLLSKLSLVNKEEKELSKSWKKFNFCLQFYEIILSDANL